MNERKELSELIAGQRLAVLATADADGRPHTSLVAFAATSDLAAIFFATPRATKKFDYLRARPEVAMLIDSRATGGIFSAAAATAYGRAAEIADPDRAAAGALLLATHPDLADFLRDPGTAIIRVSMERYKLVTHFQQTYVIAIGS